MAFDPHEFGRRLAAARARAGLKPKQLAAALGVAAETINRWERGGLENPPKRGQLRLLSQLLDQDETWLLEGNDLPPSPAPEVDPDEAARRHDVIMRELENQAEALRILQATAEAIRSRLE